MSSGFTIELGPSDEASIYWPAITLGLKNALKAEPID
jgi:hypothetical protein